MVRFLSAWIHIGHLESFGDLKPAEQHAADFAGNLCLDRDLSGRTVHVGHSLTGCYKISDLTQGMKSSCAGTVHYTLLAVTFDDSRNSCVWDGGSAVDDPTKSMSAFCFYHGVHIIRGSESRTQGDCEWRHVASGSKVLLCDYGIHHHFRVEFVD